MENDTNDLKPGDMIRCHDDKDAKSLLKDLNACGYHAVRMNDYWICITGKGKENGS